MKRITTVLLLSFMTLFLTKAQGTLQFNTVKLVSNTLATVPAGKVWKVTSVYGNSLFCDVSIASSCNWGSNNTKHVFLTSSFAVNGTTIFSYNKLVGGKYQLCSNALSSITGTPFACMQVASMEMGYPDVDANPNILPIWLEAGTTVQTNASTVFLSVMEFNVIP